jgi:crossover junction endodeoxyribonuclease RusA
MSARARRVAHLEELARAEPRLSAGPMRIAFRLPFPPSTNHYWLSLRNGPMAGRVVISTAGTRYRKAVGLEVLRQRVPRHQLTGKLEVKVLAFPPDRRARDLDNLFKSLLDSVQHAGVIRNDSEIDYLLIERGPLLTGGCVQIDIAEIAGQATDSLALPLAVRDPVLDQALAIMGRA